MSIWWVNTGARFKAQVEAGVLWCPNRTVRRDKTLGSPQWHWSIIQDVRPGEFVLVARDGFIEGIAIAKRAAAPDSARPRTFPETDSWSSTGWSLPIEFVSFDQRIARAELIEGLFRYKAHRSPFFITEDGVLEGNQVYLALLPGADAPEFFERVRVALDIQRPGELDRALERAAKDQAGSTTERKATTRSALVEARIGQGQFRQSLIDMWSGRCCTTGLQETRLLRASHIVAWAAGTEEERLNPYNGLLLSAAFDAAFDAHLITLSATGKWENVAGLSDDELERAGLRNLEQRRVTGLQPKHHEFLARHRQNAHEKWAKVPCPTG